MNVMPFFGMGVRALFYSGSICQYPREKATGAVIIGCFMLWNGNAGLVRIFDHEDMSRDPEIRQHVVALVSLINTYAAGFLIMGLAQSCGTDSYDCKG